MSESASTAGVVTFLTTEDPPMDLFRINPGVPCDYALEQVSTLLGCVNKLLQAGIVDRDEDMLCSAYYLSGFAKVVIDDVEIGRRGSKSSLKA